mgnify:CR=1 FL=1
MDTRELPLRAELFGPAQLENHAKLLASKHVLAPGPGHERLLHRLKQNEQVIRNSYQAIAEDVREGHHVTPAAEWLLDNAYLIEDQIDIAREHLPPGYSRELPRLSTGEFKGYPRIYELAFELVSHTDGRIEIGNLSLFLKAYQSIHPLKLGELWATPIMLRLALLENLRRVAYRIALRRQDIKKAIEWSKRFLDAVHKQPKMLITELADLVRSNPSMSQPFIAELVTSLHGQHSALGLVINWIEQELSDAGQTIEQILQSEGNEQAANGVSVGNSITSLRMLATLVWEDFVESLSVTEAELRRDPSGIYPDMDFRTRDRYRHVVESLAKHSRKDEQEVAALAVRLAEGYKFGKYVNPKKYHAGYFLMDEGLPEIERILNYSPSLFHHLMRYLRDRPSIGYIPAIVYFTTVPVGILLLQASGFLTFWWGWIPFIFTGILLLILVSQSAISIVNWLATILVPARGLPRMDFSKGIPDEHHTAVAIPTMLTSLKAINDLIETMEIHYLANRSRNLFFVLLTDFVDAPSQTMPDDDRLIKRAVDEIQNLNIRYAEEGQTIFFLLHRPRLWNPQERLWMGYERKRGKLQDFNLLLRKGVTDKFSLITGDISLLHSVKYIITLDTDTQLPPETAWKMIGTMAHPLNRPEVNPSTDCAVKGYGLLQPRVAISLAGASRSRFARFFSGEVGIDPYTREVSNVYHDIFSRSQFIGKGIYDLEAFSRAVGSRFPENRILSHDLIEGAYARCGFINDVELIEDHPSQYLSDINRRHRWTRGDWQIAPWLFPHVPDKDGKRVRNPLKHLYRWMIFDNLRRSLVPPALLLLFGIGWLIMGNLALTWTLSLLAIYLAPNLLHTIVSYILKPKRVFWGSHLNHVTSNDGRRLTIEIMKIVFLPYEAVSNIDAILRALWRTIASHSRLLEWRTSRDVEKNIHTGLPEYLLHMWIAPFLAVAGIVYILLFNISALVTALPFLVIWLLSPLLAWFISKPVKLRKEKLTDSQIVFLRSLARRTWMYFENFMGPERNYLPPDNFQEHPQPMIAERTSPTNIGVGLLSTLGAHDFGYISTGTFINRLHNTFSTMEKMQRYRGHFLNWYDVQTILPLSPIYVSTVDSGNLSACLITLKEGLQELAGGNIIPSHWIKGIEDTVSILAIEADKSLGKTHETRYQKILDVIINKIERIPQVSQTFPLINDILSDINSSVSQLEPLFPDENEVKFWLTALRKQVEDFQQEVLFLLPWLSMAEERPQVESENPDVTRLREEINSISTLKDLVGLGTRIGSEIDRIITSIHGISEPLKEWLKNLHQAVNNGSERATERIRLIEDLVLRCRELAETDLDFLYDPSRKLFSIGFLLEGHRRDPGYYDLFASEARVSSFLGIAQGKLPQEHWFALGRQLTAVDGAPALISWSGSMFEYLMPLIFMPVFENTLLDRTFHSAVLHQIRYGRRQGVPWGISESCYNLIDSQMNYQYRAFGVPELGLKQDLADDLVIAPYASVLALMVMPKDSCANLELMSRMGIIGRFGFYESIDYTPGRVPQGHNYSVVRSFMAHHSGMNLLAINNVLLDDRMQKRFFSDPEVRTSILLLQERVPVMRATLRQENRLLPAYERIARPEVREPVIQVYTNVHKPVPDVHLLSNGRYHVMLTSAGSGFSRWNNISLTRWREDITRDHMGFFFYLKDVKDNHTFSATHHPLCQKPDQYEAIFSQGRAEFRTRSRKLDVHTRISVSPEDDIELRRIVITNLSDRKRVVELTSFSEVSLAEPRAELSHPVFNALFIHTEALPEKSALLCTKRQSSPEESPIWFFHTLLVRGETNIPAKVSYETDRLRFIGRCRSAANPQALQSPGQLSGTADTAIDPCIAIRHRIHLGPGEAVTVDAITGVGKDRDEAFRLIDKYNNQGLADRVFELAWTQSQVLLHQLHATEADAQLFGRLAGSIIYANTRYRAGASLLSRNKKSQSDLWRYGISGDLPIVLVRVTDTSGVELVQNVLHAHAYWRFKGLKTDLFIWSDAFAGYRQNLLDQIMGIVNTGPEAKMLNQPGGIFVRSTDQIPEDERILLQSAARLNFYDRAGTLSEQVERRVRIEPNIPRLKPVRHPDTLFLGEMDVPPRELVYFNGLGGFTPDGKEYVIILKPKMVTPAPWANVLSNENFGTVITESGAGYTWYENAHQYRLTPWYNDPVCDSSGESFYIRDEETGRFWSPSPYPARGHTPYVSRHGLGYSAFEHTQDGIFTEMTAYVGVEAPVKFSLITLRNLTERDRMLSVTGFCELVLGENRCMNAMHVVTSLDPQTGAVFATNPYTIDFSDRIVFFQSSEPDRSFTADRTEFIGRNRTLDVPQAMERRRLSNRVGPGFDPCAAVQSFITVPAGQQRQVVFVLGAARTEQEARSILTRFSGIDGAYHELERVWEFWGHLLGGVYVETPDQSINFLINHWLLYQTISGRFWGRSGYYQSSGAYGFRDQLQDSMALLYECPWLTRQHILRCASRQFREGDVQHWWHPPNGRGTRTRFSDDYLWLPYVTCRYVTVTGDTGILDEQVPFLEGRKLTQGEKSYYDIPQVSDQKASLYEHCVHAIQNGLRFGPHGLPLIGCGDWNDGLSSVGKDGKGESVWLAFFLYDVLNQFSKLAMLRNDQGFANNCLDTAQTLKGNIEANAWDGHWYLRAYFDDGQPLGSVQNTECQIDSLPQSWSVISGAADSQRAKAALKSAMDILVDRELNLIRLFKPPFDVSSQEPGYIKGYLPGVRENGAQYTHAAVWLITALASLRDIENAWKLLSIINPVNHGDTPEHTARYKVEPYVLAGDVYTAKGNEGRGGWTWYTGAAGWMYRLILERFLGISLNVDTLTIAPLIPPGWQSYIIHYRFRSSMYHIHINITGPETWNVKKVLVDEQEQADFKIHLCDDHVEHNVQIQAG